MKMHHTVVEKLARIYDVYGGHREDAKLRNELLRLDLSVYTKTTGEQILVLTDELVAFQKKR